MNIKNVFAAIDLRTSNDEGDDLEIVWVDNRRVYLADRAAGLDTEDGGANKARIIH